jgi:hypothetical protein
MAEWIKAKTKRMTSPLNRELVTGRIVTRDNKLRIYFSIGRDICDLINLFPKNYVNVFMHKTQNDIFLMKKSCTFGQGYKLQIAHKNSNFLSFSFSFLSEHSYKLSQTTPLDWDFGDNEQLIIYSTKLKWSY